MSKSLYKNVSKEEIEKLYCNTLDSGKVVAKKLGMSYKTFTKALKMFDIPVKGRQSSNEKLRDKEWLKEEYFEKNKSTHTIAREIGSTPGAVHSAVIRLGREIRTTKQGLSVKYPMGRFGVFSPRWKGGIRKSGKYVMVYCPEHPAAKVYPYVMEHRLVMEKHLGRYLESDEYVHHKNGDKKDNRIENLEVVTRQEHVKAHYDAAQEMYRLRKILDEHNISY